jgi:DNA-binding MarR family transcriptional regulator
VALFLEETGSLGLTTVQYAALNMIREVPGIDQVSLSNMIAFDKTTIVKVLDRLVDKGLITRTRSTTDRRTNHLNVTAKGDEVLKRIQPMLDRSDGRILSPLSRADQRKFMEMITQLVHVNNMYSRAPLRPRRGRRPRRRRRASRVKKYAALGVAARERVPPVLGRVVGRRLDRNARRPGRLHDYRAVAIHPERVPGADDVVGAVAVLGDPDEPLHAAHQRAARGFEDERVTPAEGEAGDAGLDVHGVAPDNALVACMRA